MKRSRIDALLMEQEGLRSLTRRDIEAVQLGKLNRLLRREKLRNGFYRDLPEHLSSLEELSSLPFTTDEDLAHHAPTLLLTSQSQVSRILSDATSGTTGAAKRVFYTEADCENTVRLYAAGLGELVFPHSTCMVCFPFSGPQGLGELIAEAITRLGARPLKLGPGLTYGEYRAVMEKEKPDTFVGMPVQLLSLLRTCGKGSLQRALVSGDACPAAVTEACEKILGTKLFPHYGSREMGMAGAITCPAHEGMHLREHCVIAEIIDESGNVLPKGEWGELVITTIGMEALPLIRYRTGDYTRILPLPCPCGSETLRLDSLHRKSSGGPDILALDELLFPLSGLIDFTAEQKETTLRLSVLHTGTLTESAVRLALSALAPDTQLQLRPVTDGDKALYPAKRRILSSQP
ncbi:MAG: AMP-binding protein [Oscillospiraceae bacterium]|nr:AMP-binding protein [Oscillospiraceae bacterium]